MKKQTALSFNVVKQRYDHKLSFSGPEEDPFVVEMFQSHPCITKVQLGKG